MERSASRYCQADLMRAGDVVGRNHFLPGACSEMRRYLKILPRLAETWLCEETKGKTR